jgi:hypothetical protein
LLFIYEIMVTFRLTRNVRVRDNVPTTRGPLPFDRSTSNDVVPIAAAEVSRLVGTIPSVSHYFRCRAISRAILDPLFVETGISHTPQ